MNDSFRTTPAPMQDHQRFHTQRSNPADDRFKPRGNTQYSVPQNSVMQIEKPLHSDVDQKKPYKSYMNVKSHGTKTAIEVAPDETTKEWHTIRLEAAGKVSPNGKEYDWKSKISVQLTKQELPVVIGVMLGYLPSAEYGNHGDKNKGFSIENQSKNYFFKVLEGASSRLFVCPVPIVEAHLMGMLALSQYVKNFEGMSCEAGIIAIRTMCSQMIKSDAFPKVRQSGRR
jgi:hypothetical protein